LHFKIEKYIQIQKRGEKEMEENIFDDELGRLSSVL